jgi:hypothetical protein
VGIGLSLQDLANEMTDSDEEEEERVGHSRNSSRYSKEDGDTEVDAYSAALSRV